MTKITYFNKVKNPKVYFHEATLRQVQQWGADVPLKTK